MSARHRIPPLIYRIVLALSLIPVLVLPIFWIRGYFVRDFISHENIVDQKNSSDRRVWLVESASGYIFFSHVHEFRINLNSHANFQITRSNKWQIVHQKPLGTRYPGDGPPWLALLGIRWQFNHQDIVVPNHTHFMDGSEWFQIDHWTPILFLASLFIAGLIFQLYCRRILPDRRAKQGLCPACGYDLRHTPDRCPECGTVVLQKST